MDNDEKKDMIKYVYTLIAAAAVILTIGCSGNAGGGNGKSAEEQAKEKKADSLALKVGVGQTIDCLPAFLAKDEGVFDSLGIDVRLRHYNSLLDCNASLKANKIDGAFTDVKSIEHLKAESSTDLKQVMKMPMQWTLVTNRLSRLYKLKQFTDKMVAMSRYSATDYLCDKMVDSVKLDKERVFRIQVNDVDLRLKMLLNNEIDAAWLPEPQTAVALKHGHKAMMQSGAEQLAVLAFSAAAMADKEKKRQIDLFVKGYTIAQQRIKDGGTRYYSRLVEHYYKYNINK